jgi:hypothetical protein
MLTNDRLPVCLSLASVDRHLFSFVETAATVYRKDYQRFHILLSGSSLPDWEPEITHNNTYGPRLIWLELSPNRLVMTMQGSQRLNYRHFWERGIYGVSRYWLQSDSGYESFRLRNYTRNFQWHGRVLPEHLRLEYELWTESLCLGRYVLNLEIEGH